MDASLPLVAVAAFAGAAASGFAGFGFSAVAGAVLMHTLEPLIAVPLMMLCSVITQSVGIVHLRIAARPSAVLPLCAGGVAGLAIGIPILGALDAGGFRAVFGAVLLCYGAAALRGPCARPKAWHGPSFAERAGIGLLGGAIGALTALPSTALVIWADRRGLDKAELRGAVQPFVLTMQICALAGMGAAGMLDWVRLVPLVLAAMPPLAFGCALGLWLYGRVEQGLFRSAMLWTLIGAGAALLAA